MAPRLKCNICAKEIPEKLTLDKSIAGRKLQNVVKTITGLRVDKVIARKVTSCEACSTALVQVEPLIRKLKRLLEIKIKKKNERMQKSKSGRTAKESDDFVAPNGGRVAKQKLDKFANEMLKHSNGFENDAEEDDNDEAKVTLWHSQGSKSCSQIQSHSFNVREQFHCSLCSFKSADPAQFRQHLISEHDIEKPCIHQCYACSKSFYRLSTLQSHIEYAHKQRRGWRTRIDSNRSDTLSDSSVFGANHEGPAKCVLCGRKFKGIRELRNHMDTRHLMRPAVKSCANCDAKFRSPAMYERHVFSQKCKNAIVPCQHLGCNRRFTNAQTMHNHMVRVHPEEEELE